MGAEYIRLQKEHPETPDNMQARPLCLIYRGSSCSGTSEPCRELLAAHDRYVDGLRREDKLGAAGHIEGEKDLLGVLIFRAVPVEEAQSLLQDDPAVKSGAVRLEFHRWWCAEHVLPW